MMSKMFTALIPLAALAACSTGQPAGNVSGTMAQSTAQTLDDFAQRQRAYLEGLTPAQGWTVTPTGLRYRRTAGAGQGPKPTVADTVSIYYTGTLIDGTGFDATPEGGPPASFPLGRLIPAWQEGIPLMSVGDTYEFAVPAELGYGAEGAGPIPPDSTLLFTVRLVGIQGR